MMNMQKGHNKFKEWSVCNYKTNNYFKELTERFYDPDAVIIIVDAHDLIQYSTVDIVSFYFHNINGDSFIIKATGFECNNEFNK